MRLEKISEVLWEIPQSFFYGQPEVVGTIRIVDTTQDHERPGCLKVRLDLPRTETGEDGTWVSGVSADMALGKGKIATVVVRRERRDARMLPVKVGEFFASRSESWLVAIILFDRTKHSSSDLSRDKSLNNMFSVNLMDSSSYQAFYERFLKTRTRIPPPFRVG